VTYRYAESQGLDMLSTADLMDEHAAEIESYVWEPALAQVRQAGIGFIHSGMPIAGLDAIISLYNKGILRILVCPVELCWKAQCVAHLVIVMGTKKQALGNGNNCLLQR
jgi:hypothetical protein